MNIFKEHYPKRQIIHEIFLNFTNLNDVTSYMLGELICTGTKSQRKEREMVQRTL